LQKLLTKNPEMRPSVSELLSSPFLFMNSKTPQSANLNKSPGMVRSPSLGAE